MSKRDRRRQADRTQARVERLTTQRYDDLASALLWALSLNWCEKPLVSESPWPCAALKVRSCAECWLTSARVRFAHS